MKQMKQKILFMIVSVLLIAGVVICDRPLNCDYIYLAVLMVLLSVLLYYLLFLNRGRISRETILTGVILAAAAFFVSTPMFRPGIFKASGLMSSMSAIEGVKNALKSGQFPAYVDPYALNGYGRFCGQLPNLFLYPAAFLRLLGISLITSYKSLLFAVNLGTGVIAYVSAKRLFGQAGKASLLFAILYVTGFYRVSLLWSRSDLGELLGMMFLPLVVAGLYELLAGDRKKWWYLALGYGCLLQCHIPTLVITVLFSLFVWVWYIDVFFKEKRWVEMLKTLGCALVFNAWYLVPLITYAKAGVNVMGQHVDFAGGVLYVMDLFLLDSYKVIEEVQAGYLGLSVLLCAFFALVGLTMEKKINERQKYLSILLAAGVGFALLATQFVPWQLFEQAGLIEDLTRLIRYPRCFLGIAVTALLAAGTGWLWESFYLKKYAIFAGGGVAVLAALVAVLNLIDCQVENVNLISMDELPVAVEQTGLLQGTDQGDLSPWPRVSDEGKVAVTDYGREGKQADLYFSSESGNQFVELPVFNYPGYRAFDQNRARLPIETGTNNRVRVLISSAGQDQAIHLEFAGKRIFWGGYLATLAAALWTLWGILKTRRPVVGGGVAERKSGKEQG